MNSSYIRNSKFESNDSKEFGTVFVTFDSGMIEISENSFHNNHGCISMSTNTNRYTFIKSNIFQRNEGIIISLLEKEQK